MVIGIAGALVLGGAWLYRQFTHVVVSDARIADDMVSISSRVPGWVTTRAVVDGDSPARGTLLVAIDARESRLLVDELDARLSGVAARREELLARIRMIDRRTSSGIASKQAAARAAGAGLAAAAAREKLARLDNERYEHLGPTGAVSRAQLDQARVALETAREQVRSAEADLENARAGLAQAQADREEIEVLRRQLAELDPEERQLRAQRDRARLDLEDRRITMPFDGVVDKTFVDPGEYVTPGQRLLMVHDPGKVRVDANVKETELRFFRPGKRVAITVDALPGETFEGVVDRVGQAATSEFALLPNPNPSGNFTKITQRLPLRITVRQRGGLLKPGMMVEVEASTGDH
jgi:membrane fusion protein (multidrug efflux system)